MDLKGFGLSDKPADGHYAVADQAEMVADFIRRQDLGDLVIMGHSMGGGVTLMTYLKLQGDRSRTHQKAGAHRQRRLSAEAALVHLDGQGPRTQYRAQQAAVAPVRRRPGAEKMLL